MRKSLFALCVLALGLTACAPSAGAVQTAIAETQAAEPTATVAPATATPNPSPTTFATVTPTAAPTSIPLASINLAPLLVEDGDLPAGFSGAQQRDYAPADFDKLPKPTKVAYQELQKNGQQGGFVVVFLYDKPADVDSAESSIFIGVAEVAAAGVGEKARMGDTTKLSGWSVDIAFSRCHAVAEIWLIGGLTADGTQYAVNNDELIAYARRLDARLTPLVC